MKKIYPIFILLIPAMLLFVAFTQGPPAGYTGSPLDGIDCTDCHMPGPATVVNNWITTNIPVDGYTPGTKYTVTLTAHDIAVEQMGFQITSETGAAKTGT